MKNLAVTRRLVPAMALAASIAVLGVGQALLQQQAEAQSGVTAPVFEVDPLWPKPLPEQLAARLDHRSLGR